MEDFFSTALLIADSIKDIMDHEFAVVMALTFLVCEGLFMAYPKGTPLKQLTAIAVGGILGFLTITETPVPNYIAGALAGGLTTMLVGKFKNNNT